MIVPVGTLAPSNVTIPQKLEGVGGAASAVAKLLSVRAMVNNRALKIR